MDVAGSRPHLRPGRSAGDDVEQRREFGRRAVGRQHWFGSKANPPGGTGPLPNPAGREAAVAPLLAWTRCEEKIENGPEFGRDLRF